MGVFQIESRAQMQMLHRTLPESLDDLTVQVALVRPGPIQGGAVHPYIERRKRAAGRPGLQGALRAPVARAGAEGHARRDRLPGPGDRGGDGVRRLLARRGRGAAPRDEPQALGGGDALVRGEVRRRARSRAAPRARWPSGSTSRSSASPASASPRRTRPRSGCSPTSRPGCACTTAPEFLCALLNEQPMGFYPPDSLVHEAQRRGMEVLPPDVVSSSRRSARASGVDDATRARRSARARLRQRRRGGRGAGDRRRAGRAGAVRLGGRPGRAVRAAAGVARAAGLGGRVRRAVRRAGGARRCGSSASPRRGCRCAAACSSRCRSSRTTRPRCASCRRGSGCWPTTARPR